MGMTTSIMPFAFLSLYMLLSLALSEFSPSNINLWCSETPYPEPCQYYMSHNSNYSAINQKSEFAFIVIQVALEQALQAQKYTMPPQGRFQNERVKAALADCHEHFENAILRLKLTITHYGSQSTDVDRQTWLSAAITNLETCRTGFDELEVSDHILPLVSNNVSKLLSNALAINNVASSSVLKYKNGFPTWVSDSDLKLLQAASPSSQANHDLVVAQDGSGDFKTIKEAVNVVPKRKGAKRFFIYVKAGTYKENVQIGKKWKNIMLVGDGIGKTIVTGSKHAGRNTTTFKSATFAVTGDGFIACDMTFQNTAGPLKGQAVALRSGSDFSVFYRCSFEGYQDTLYVHSNRQFYRECEIYGTVDFIFGNAVVVFQDCNIYARRAQNKINTVTAQGRSNLNQNTGIVIQNCSVLPGAELEPFVSSVRTYLGRPWRKYSRTVVLSTYLGSLIDPAGWLEWDDDDSYLSTLYYGEYNNTGPGSLTANRVKWGGFHVITSPSEASNFTVENFLLGDSWLNSTGVPFTSGL